MNEEKKRTIAIEIPEAIARDIEENWGNIERRTLEALAVEGYRTQVFSAGQVRWMLDLVGCYEVDRFLKERKVDLNYDEADLERDLQVLNKLTPE